MLFCCFWVDREDDAINIIECVRRNYEFKEMNLADKFQDIQKTWKELGVDMGVEGHFYDI